MGIRLGIILVALSLTLTWGSIRSTQTPVKGGTFVYGRGADSVGLDPAVVTDGESFRVTRNVYESLLEYKRTSTEVVAGLAERWEASPDLLRWKFTLRRQVKFHDGTPFNAEAVVFNFERWMFENHPHHKGVFEYWKSMFGGFPGFVSAVKAVDDSAEDGGGERAVHRQPLLGNRRRVRVDRRSVGHA